MASSNGYIYVRNLERYQHYKDRRPPWVKLHRDILSDYRLMSCSDTVKWIAVGLILLASESNGGEIPYDPSWIGSRLHVSVRAVRPAVERLEAVEFVEVCEHPASNAQAVHKHSANPDSSSVSYSERNKKEVASAAAVIELLNDKTGRRFPLRNPNGKLTTNANQIVARLRDGWSEAHLRAVVVRRWRRWKDDPKMSDYLQPSTLFRKSNFERYVSEVEL